MTDRELLALVLGTGASGQSALALAEELLARFADLRRMSEAGLAELCEVPGVGRAQACRVQAALALAGRLWGRPYDRGEPLGSADDVYDRVGARLAFLGREVFHVIGLDARARVVVDRQLARGGVCSVDIAPRDVFATLIRESAVSVVFVHNHPSGDPTPSLTDRELTQRLARAGLLIGIRMIDHIVVGSQGWYSFAEGRFSPISRNFCPEPGVG